MEFFQARDFQLVVEHGSSPTVRDHPQEPWRLAFPPMTDACLASRESSGVLSWWQEQRCLNVKSQLPFVGAGQQTVDLHFEVVYMQLAASLKPSEDV